MTAAGRGREELHEEYAYEPDELEEYLRAAGFRRIRRYGELKMRPPGPARSASFSLRGRTDRAAPLPPPPR